MAVSGPLPSHLFLLALPTWLLPLGSSGLFRLSHISCPGEFVSFGSNRTFCGRYDEITPLPLHVKHKEIQVERLSIVAFGYRANKDLSQPTVVKGCDLIRLSIIWVNSSFPMCFFHCLMPPIHVCNCQADFPKKSIPECLRKKYMTSWSLYAHSYTNQSNNVFIRGLWRLNVLMLTHLEHRDA